MNIHSKKLVLVLFFLVTTKVFSQSDIGGDTGKENLAGTWTASCPIEFQDKVTMRHCEICPFVIQEDKSLAAIEDVDMTFDDSTISINRKNETEKVSYQMESEMHTFSFKYKNAAYRFRVFYGDDEVILEERDGLIVIMKRKEN